MGSPGARKAEPRAQRRAAILRDRMAAPALAPHALAPWPAEGRFQRAQIVANPVSGRGQGLRAAQDLLRALQQNGLRAELHLTTGRNDAFHFLRALDHEVDLVVAVGGDGTVREVVSGLVQTDTPIGILPMGTANVLASEFGLPRDVHAAVEILLRGRQRRFDVSDVNGYLSCFVTGVGIDGMAVQEVERCRKGPITKLAYVRALLRVLPSYTPPALSIELDGLPLDGPRGLVLVSSVRGYGGLFRLIRDAAPDDGLLEVYAFESASRLALARAALRGLVSEIGNGCELRRARSVRVTSEQPVPYQVDGDFRGHTPVEIQVSARQYRLVVP